MKLQGKLLLPLFISVVACCAIGLFFINREFSVLERSFIKLLAQSKVADFNAALDTASTEALEQAAQYSKLPPVIEAFTLAHTGDINAPDSPQSQKAREIIRAALKSSVQGLKETTGQSLRLHYHLPNGAAWSGCGVKNRPRKAANGWTSPTTSPPSARRSWTSTGRTAGQGNRTGTRRLHHSRPGPGQRVRRHTTRLGRNPQGIRPPAAIS